MVCFCFSHLFFSTDRVCAWGQTHITHITHITHTHTHTHHTHTHTHTHTHAHHHTRTHSSSRLFLLDALGDAVLGGAALLHLGHVWYLNGLTFSIFDLILLVFGRAIYGDASRAFHILWSYRSSSFSHFFFFFEFFLSRRGDRWSDFSMTTQSIHGFC